MSRLEGFDDVLSRMSLRDDRLDEAVKQLELLLENSSKDTYRNHHEH